VLSLGREVTLRVGKLGRFTFPAGYYSISCITVTPVMQEMAHRRHAKHSVASCCITLKQETLYVYTGSARAGLEARIARRRRREKRMRWHIDYLLREARIVEVAAIPAPRRSAGARRESTASLALP
jgi:Uri superfamily endonuclease